MTLIEQNTIYPRLKATITAHDLAHVYTPTDDEQAWAREETGMSDDAATLGCLIHLKTFQRLGYFVAIKTMPQQIIAHIAMMTGLTSAIPWLEAYQRSGSPSRYYEAIRALRGVTAYREGGALIIEQAVAEAALHHQDLAALINIAIETPSSPDVMNCQALRPLSKLLVASARLPIQHGTPILKTGYRQTCAANWMRSSRLNWMRSSRLIR